MSATRRENDTADITASRETTATDRRASSLPTLLTVPELAELLGLHEKTVYDWAARGKLPCIRLGNRLRFSATDIARWVASRKGGG